MTPYAESIATMKDAMYTAYFVERPAPEERDAKLAAAFEALLDPLLELSQQIRYAQSRDDIEALRNTFPCSLNNVNGGVINVR